MNAKNSLQKITPFDFVLGVVYAVVLNAVLFGNGYFVGLPFFLLATVCTSVVGVALSYLHYLLALRVTRVWAGLYGVTGQLLIHLLFFWLTAGVTTAVFFGYHWLHFPGYTLRMENYKWALLVGFIADLLGMGFGMALHTQTALKQAELEKERLQKLQLQNELEILKNQVNPHFLFNSLNVLSSLIGEEPQKAEAFVNELSKVYRYLLQKNHQAWCSLADELRFIEAYAFLLNTRYGNALQLAVAVDEAARERQLPPLTLQLLVENAVKHNVVHRSQPLLIEIVSQGETLSVRNNVQKKARREVISHGIGLKNIAEKYRLLRGQTILVEEDSRCFCVTLPLVEALPEPV